MKTQWKKSTTSSTEVLGAKGPLVSAFHFSSYISKMISINILIIVLFCQ
ncbi:MAG: hypothetical protein PUG10_11395 [Lachnospiraceae bacterium]|nr:hypothetical protein [Lachnospiraceae bacterium]